MAGRSAKLQSLEIGHFQDSIIIQSNTPTSDNGGGQTLVWATAYTVWAQIRPYRGRKVLFGGQLQSLTTHLIHIPYQTGITSAMRILFGARLFNIQDVDDVEEAHEFLEMTCIEGDGTGVAT
jgi:SPP1 family predicted phage head-tail adaptor